MANGRARSTFVSAFVLAIAMPATAQVPLGPEFRVDTQGDAGNESTSGGRTVAVAPDGSFVVTWIATTAAGGDLRDVVARRFDAAGVPLGAEFIVNASTLGNQGDQSVAMDGAGNFVVVWHGTPTVPGYGWTYAQRFGSSGQRLGGELRVNTQSVVNSRPSVAVAPADDFVVVWNGPDGVSYGVFGRRFTAAGVPLGSEFQINTNTTGREERPKVDMDALGNFVVVWGRYPHLTSLIRGPSGQRFSAGGARVGAEFQVSSSTSTSQGTTPQLSVNPDGSFIVAWSGDSPQDPSGGIVAHRFDAGGVPLGGDFLVNQFTPNTQTGATVDADATGNFVIAWRCDADGSSFGVCARRYDAGGTPGNEFVANTYTTLLQWQGAVASDPAGNFVIAWRSDQFGIPGVYARRYAAAGGLSPAALAVDPAAGGSSDGNGVLEPGETAAVAPAWRNANLTALAFTGTASSFTGPGVPGNPTYSVTDGAASYGTVAGNATGSCAATGDCYALDVSVPTSRPAQHWDATFHEVIAPANLGAAKTWTLHVGDSFTDVPRASGFYRFVETLLHHSVTGGCAASTYCPSSSTTREQMAVFVLVAKEGAGYVPAACTTPVFTDVPASSPFCPWIEELARRGVVGGCGSGTYCPAAAVSREQMAVFALLTKEPGITPPTCGTPRFNDVPASSLYCRWIEELARRGVVTGCGGGNYCPAAAVTREQMAVFLSVTFGLMLYGP